MTTVHTQSHTLPDWPPALNCSNYSTKFWDFKEWKTWFNSTEGHGTIKSCGSIPFLEDASRDPLTSANIDAICCTMHRLFEMLASKDIAPPSWGHLFEQAYLLFHIAIGTAHPEVRLCLNNWKANELVKNVYSAWVKGIKPEELNQDDLGFYPGDNDNRDNLEKWSTPENLTCTTKRYKPSSSSSSVCIIDSIIRPNCFPPVTAPLPSPALISTGTTVVSQPDTHIQEYGNEPPNLKALPIEALKKGSGKARASSKKNGRDLCLLHPLKQIRKEGSSLEFCMYWDALNQQQHNSYDSEAKELSSSKTWVKNTVLAVIDSTLY
ncbi:hypothetical protein BDR05DRAFT_953052 [Suillus weaverae]|nr:hypothetical protein BDR05DRAFT_953052 [Suillus weaverae]